MAIVSWPYALWRDFTLCIRTYGSENNIHAVRPLELCTQVDSLRGTFRRSWELSHHCILRPTHQGQHRTGAVSAATIDCLAVCCAVCSPDRALLEDSQYFTVLIKNYIEFPKFHRKRCVAESVFSFLRQLSTWHCSHLLLSAVLRRRCCWTPDGRRCRTISPALSSRPAARRSCGRSMGQTDGRTDARPFHRHCSAYRASSVGVRYFIINTKNCSLSIMLTATDQKPQKSLKRWYYPPSHLPECQRDAE